ncbi:hypothetical protein ABBQ32_006905 [Trebouxia sp. C0010 RCD-2024]
MLQQCSQSCRLRGLQCTSCKTIFCALPLPCTVIILVLHHSPCTASSWLCQINRCQHTGKLAGQMLVVGLLQLLPQCCQARHVG